MTCHLELQFSTTVKVVEKLRSKCLVSKDIFFSLFSHENALKILWESW